MFFRLGLFLACIIAAAQEPAKVLLPDPRYKADVLLVVAHPDDDVVIGGYLAKIAIDDHKRVAVIYCTNGDGGGNAVGNEAGAALGQMRVIEARRALAHFGIENVWFLGGHDTPGQDPLRSLDVWGHGRMLDEVVRLVRLTRPDVVITWLPASVVGENHGDHQASGVLAVEAFDLAGDPTQFPEQVAAPRNRTGMSNLTEGLHVWQPQKLYFATDAYEDFGPYWHDSGTLSTFRKNFLDGQGPVYPNTAVSPSRHKTYARLTAEQQTFYLTQEASLGLDAIAKNSDAGFEYPTRIIFGKSVAESAITADVFAGLATHASNFVRAPGYQAATANALEIGGHVAFYRQFWRAHGIDRIASFMPVPEFGSSFHRTLDIPLNVTNTSTRAAEFRLSATLPPGWSENTRDRIIQLQPGETYALQAQLATPAAGEPAWHEITWTLSSEGRPVGTAQIRVFLERHGGMPQ